VVYFVGLFLVIFVPSIIIYVWFYMKPEDVHEKSLAELKADYTNALTALRSDPTNPALHEQALDLGRIYSAATRTNKAVTLFDETALANDIRAVTANATQTTKPVSALNSSAALATSFDDRINTLLKLKASGLITDAEFDQKRKEMLDSI